MVNERLSIRYERMEHKVRNVSMDEETPTVVSYASDTTYPRKCRFTKVPSVSERLRVAIGSLKALFC